ncbi:hypothetical protein L249_3763, partial [Ophiocordyceps polyrhachis-furcata BCC 54312]
TNRGKGLARGCSTGRSIYPSIHIHPAALPVLDRCIVPFERFGSLPRAMWKFALLCLARSFAPGAPGHMLAYAALACMTYGSMVSRYGCMYQGIFPEELNEDSHTHNVLRIVDDQAIWYDDDAPSPSAPFFGAYGYIDTGMDSRGKSSSHSGETVSSHPAGCFRSPCHWHPARMKKKKMMQKKND